MRRRRPLSGRVRTVALVALAGVAGAGGSSGCRPRGEVDATEGGGSQLSAAALLGGGDDGTGFERALVPVPLELPRDHGPHPHFRSEWWYFTGILQTAPGSAPRRRFGYQLTIFRQALAAHPAARASARATANIYMGHLAISDLDGDPVRPRFHAFQRFARDGLGLAGARAVPFQVWVDDWQVAGRGALPSKSLGRLNY